MQNSLGVLGGCQGVGMWLLRCSKRFLVYCYVVAYWLKAKEPKPKCLQYSGLEFLHQRKSVRFFLHVSLSAKRKS